MLSLNSHRLKMITSKTIKEYGVGRLTYVFIAEKIGMKAATVRRYALGEICPRGKSALRIEEFTDGLLEMKDWHKPLPLDEETSNLIGREFCERFVGKIHSGRIEI